MFLNMCVVKIYYLFNFRVLNGALHDVYYKEGALGLRELVSYFQNLKRPTKHCASFSVMADAR